MRGGEEVMNEKEEYIKKFQDQMDKYKNKISQIDNFLENYTSGDRESLTAQRADLKNKFDEAEQMLKKIQASSDDTFEKIKENASEIFDAVKDAFYNLFHLLTLEKLYRAKDEIINLSNEKVHEIDDLIKSHPFISIGSALGIGFIIGTLLARSK